MGNRLKISQLLSGFRPYILYPTNNQGVKKMKLTHTFTMLLTALVIFAFTSSPVWALEWTKEQKEVWKTVEDYTDLIAKGDVAGFLSYFDEDYKGWSYNSPLPYGKESVAKWVGYWIPKRNVKVHEITPVAVEVYGDFAFVHYYFSRVTESKDGKPKYSEGRWTDILRKKNGSWKLIGDHGGETDDD